MKPLDVVPYMGLIVAIGVLVDSAEVLTARRALSPTGLYSWDVLGSGRRYLVKGALGHSLRRLFRYPAVLVLPSVQILAGAALLTAWALPPGPTRVVVAVAALTAAAARMLFYMRQQLGLDGADQMTNIVLLSTGFGALLGNTPAGYAATLYAALQLVLSYEISGIAKAVSKQWRSGRAIVDITGTIAYGQPWFHRYVETRHRVALALCWSVILFECASPLLVLGGTPGVALLALCGLGFHLGVAVIMGLNTFVWAFTAAYPAVLLLASQLPTAGLLTALLS